MQCCCIYLRKSRADAEAEACGEGETLARHEKALLELAKRLHLTITQIYCEVVSGDTIAARPMIQKLLSEVEQGMWEGVLVMEVERLARGNTIDQGIIAQSFKFSNTKIITPSKTYDPNNEFDEEYFEFGLFMSRREYKTINRRLQRGRMASINEGKFIASTAPYGYEKVKITDSKGYTLKPIPEQAEIVKYIFELYTKGELQPDGTYRRLGSYLIARKLNVMQIPPPGKNTDVWTTSTITTMLRNHVYDGKIRWNWRPEIKSVVDGKVKVVRPKRNPDCYIVEGLHEAILDKGVFDEVQDNLSKNTLLSLNSTNKLKSPLAGIVVCGYCGRKMERRSFNHTDPSRQKNDHDVIMCPNPECKNISSRLDAIETKIISCIADWLTQYRLKWESDNPNNELSSAVTIKADAVKAIRQHISQLEKQLDNTHELLETGVYDTVTFLKRSKIISQRIDEAKQQLDNTVNEYDFETQRRENIDNFIPIVEHLLEVYSTIESPAVKNKMLKEILLKVVYKKEKGGRWNAVPENFIIEIYPHVPT